MYGSASPASAAMGAQAAAAFGVDPAVYDVAFTAFWASANEDCSSPFPLSTSSLSADLVTNPLLFTATAPTGTYPCIVMQISDVFTFVPAATEGVCEAGVTYSVDTYRDGPTDFLDADGIPVIGRGTDEAPVDDQMMAMFSTNPAAVIARGYSPNQTSPLTGALVVPGTTTFFVDLSGGVIDEGGQCRTSGSSQGFR